MSAVLARQRAHRRLQADAWHVLLRTCDACGVHGAMAFMANPTGHVCDVTLQVHIWAAPKRMHDLVRAALDDALPELDTVTVMQRDWRSPACQYPALATALVNLEAL